jgi:Outer membrane protein beta-barrel domain
MKRLPFQLLVGGLLFFSRTDAQNFTLGVRGGISIPNLTAGGSNKTPLNTGYSSRLGPEAAVFAEFKFSDLFSLVPMIEYSSQGGKKNGLQAFTPPAELAPFLPPGSYPYADYKSEAKLNYLMIPVLAKFGWSLGKSSPWRIWVDAGPFVGFLVSAKQVTSGNSEVFADPGGQQPLPIGKLSFDSTQSIKDQLHTTNAGIEGNVGLGYRIGPNCIFIEGGGNYGFLNIQKGTMIGKNNTGAATVTLGYSRKFGK